MSQHETVECMHRFAMSLTALPQIQETMTAILDALLERQNAYVEARKLAEEDPRIDLTIRDGPQLVQVCKSSHSFSIV